MCVCTSPLTLYSLCNITHMTDSPAQAVTLENQMEDLREDDIDEALFLIHLGDFNQPQQTDCDLNHFQSVRDILAQSPVPTLVMAGDNDYQECPSKDEAWENYLDTFVGFEEDEWDPEFDVDRNSGGSSSRPGGRDLFSFYEKGILFISTALLNKSDRESSSDFQDRLEASEDWVRENLRRYQNDDPRGVVLFGHAEKNDSLENFFGQALKDMFEEEGYGDINALYLCGDRHRYRTTRGLFGWDKLDYISVDQGGCAAPILVEVAPEDELFSSDSNVFGGGLFRIDRRGGRYSSCN